MTRAPPSRRQHGGQNRHYQAADVDGVRTHGAGIPPLEQQGVIDDLKISGGLIAVDGGD
jgi:hypothetical protein